MHIPTWYVVPDIIFTRVYIRSRTRLNLPTDKYVCLAYQIYFLPEYFHFSTPAAGIFSPSRLRGTQGARVYTTAQVWVPAGLHSMLWAFKFASYGK